MMTMHYNIMKIKKMSGIVWNLLDCGLWTTQHVTVLSGFVESIVSITCWTSS